MLENVESDVSYQVANVTSFWFLIQIVTLEDIRIGTREPWLIAQMYIHIIKSVSRYSYVGYMYLGPFLDCPQIEI